MRYLRNLGIYLRADAPNTQTSILVGKFIQEIACKCKLENLTIMITTDLFYPVTLPGREPPSTQADLYMEAELPWDLLDGTHPVAQGLLMLARDKPAKHLMIRLHDGACFYPRFACLIQTVFEETLDTEDHTLTFSRSCTCPPNRILSANHGLINPQDEGRCLLCGWNQNNKAVKPPEVVQSDPRYMEANDERVSDMQFGLMVRNFWG
jgi:hypothetical protein